jgi:hypothetical protein
MSYSWGASRDSARAGGIALDRVMPPSAGAPSRPVETREPVHGGGDNGMPEQQRVADELAPMVEVWQRLLAQHVPDRAGRCRTCTKGGTGLPTTPWPCVIHGIADMARRSHDEQQRSRAS